MTPTLFTGSGDDTILWDPGDGSDIVSGEEGQDRMLFDGSVQDERFAVAADGFGGAKVTRDVDDVALSLDRVEDLDINASNGTDTVLVSDLSDFHGTGLETITANLMGLGPGPSDNREDTVIVTGSNADDSITVTNGPGSVDVNGLSTSVKVVPGEQADRLEVNGLSGDDAIDATGLAGQVLGYRAAGDSGNDTLLGGATDDILSGGEDADVLFAGSGDNVVFGGNGDDVLRGEEGDDFLDGQDGDDILIGGAGDDILLNGEVVFDE